MLSRSTLNLCRLVYLVDNGGLRYFLHENCVRLLVFSEFYINGLDLTKQPIKQQKVWYESWHFKQIGVYCFTGCKEF